MFKKILVATFFLALFSGGQIRCMEDVGELAQSPQDLKRIRAAHIRQLISTDSLEEILQDSFFKTSISLGLGYYNDLHTFRVSATHRINKALQRPGVKETADIISKKKAVKACLDVAQNLEQEVTEELRECGLLEDYGYTIQDAIAKIRSDFETIKQIEQRLQE